MMKIEALLRRLPLIQLQENICLSFEQEKLYIDGKKGELTTDRLPVSVTFVLSEADCLQILMGQSSMISLFLKNKVVISGSYSAAFKFNSILG